MSKWNKPDTDSEVRKVIKDYILSKNWYTSDKNLDFITEDCILFWEGKGWKGVAFWPAVVKRWVLTEKNKKYSRINTSNLTSKPKGKSVREKLLEKENEF